MTDLKIRLLKLLDKIELLLQNNTAIQRELIKLIVKPDLEDILGIKVYLGSDYSENIKIGEEIPNPFPQCREPVSSFDICLNGTIMQDCAGNNLFIPENKTNTV